MRTYSVAAIAAFLTAWGCGEASAATPPTPTLSCGAPTKTSTAGASSNSLTATVAGNDVTHLYTQGSKITVTLLAVSKAADTIDWTIADYATNVRASGAISVPAGTTTANIVCSSTRAGYFAVLAKLIGSGAVQPQMGSRPAGITTFGVLPNVTDYVPAFQASLDSRRFGLVGASYETASTGLQPMNEDAGTTWLMDSRSMITTEPSSAGQYNPNTYPIDPSIKEGTLARVINISGLPRWASTEPSTANSGSYPPKSYSAYQSYVALVGEESARLHNSYIPNQHKNFYQVTWEPDTGTPTQWMGTEAQMVELYQAAYAGAHSTDANAAIMGPASSGIPPCISWLNQYASTGMVNYLDAVSCHGYFTIGASSSKPPESNGLITEMQQLRTAMANAHLKSGTPLFMTETGISYPMGSKYASNFPTALVLEQHGEAVVRTHLIFLGEGVDTTLLFYAADFMENCGFGMFFNLSMSAAHDFAATSVSPKPAIMAMAAATRLVEGSRSLGALTNMPAGGYGYAFRLADNTHAMIAVWAHDSTFNASEGYAVQVAPTGTSGTTLMFDSMGNPQQVNYSNGVVQVNITEMPKYVLSSNIAAASSHVRVPVGYSTAF